MPTYNWANAFERFHNAIRDGIVMERPPLLSETDTTEADPVSLWDFLGRGLRCRGHIYRSPCEGCWMSTSSHNRMTGAKFAMLWIALRKGSNAKPS